MELDRKLGFWSVFCLASGAMIREAAIYILKAAKVV